MTEKKEQYSLLDRVFTFWLYLAAMFFISNLLDEPGWGWQVLDVAVAAGTAQWAVERTIRHAKADDAAKAAEKEEGHEDRTTDRRRRR